MRRKLLLDKTRRSSHARKPRRQGDVCRQPDTPAAEVEDQFAELLFRWTTLRSLDKEVQGAALDLSELSEAEYEQFALLQQQVANAGLRHGADDAGDRDSAKRFHDTIARLKAENIAGQRGKRTDRRLDRS